MATAATMRLACVNKTALSVAPSSSSSCRRVVVCKAELPKAVPASTRRVALLGLGLAAFPAVQMTNPKNALALLPDDDDADLVEKAKAARQERIKKEFATERKYAKDSGFSTQKDQEAIIPVQKAVFELAKSGSQLESGDLSQLASTVGGSWLKPFKTASGKISSGNADAEKSIGAVYSGIDALAAAANKGDVSGSKKAYVATVAAFQSWASATGVASSLKGL
ncbi:hypothetical protein BSKO_10933 [Bryopsis sp. KO-2023]|nr:hypothetical protein BSKO_10933 [Bryopsis sp. KO-2023]